MFSKLFSSKLFGKARDARRPRGGSSRREQQRRFIPRVEQLERRDVPSGTAYISGGVLNVICGGGSDTVILDHNSASASASVVIDGGAPMSFSDSSYNSISISGGINGLTTNIRAIARSLTLVGYHDQDTVNVGDRYNQLSLIRGLVFLRNAIGHNNVNIHDESDLYRRQVYVLDESSVAFGVIIANTEIDCWSAETSSVTVNTGSGGSTVDVFSTRAPTRIVQWGTSDVVNVGDHGADRGALADIQSSLTVVNVPSYSDLNIHDELDGGNRTANISGTAITGLSNGPIYTTAGSIRNLTVNGGQGTNTYTITGTPAASSFTLDTGAGNDTTNLQGNSTPTTITTPEVFSGNAVVNIGRPAGANTFSLSGITATVTISNYRGHDNVNINDSADGGNHNVTIANTGASAGVAGLAPAEIHFDSSSVNTVTVAGGTGNDTYTVAGTPASSLVVLATGVGSNTVNVQTTTAFLSIYTTTGIFGGGSNEINIGNANSLAGILGSVNIANTPSYFPSHDHITINGLADGGNHNVTLSNTGASAGVAGLAPAEIHFDSSSVNALTVRGGTANNTYTVQSTPAATSIFLDAGSGTDTVNVQTTNARLDVHTAGGGGNDVVNIGNANSVAGILGTVSIFDNPSRDRININDQADTADHPGVVITNAGAGGVTGLAPAAINFTSAGCNQLVVNTGSGNNTVTIPSTPASTSVTVNTGAGGAAAVNVQGNSVPVIVNAGGTDTVTLSNAAHTLDGISNVTVNGSTSSAVVVDDSSYSGDETYSITRNTVNAARLGGSPLLTYSGLGRLVVYGGNAATSDLFTIDSTSCPLDVHGGAGPNCFSISPFSNSLAAITAPLNIIGSGADVISFWDQYNPASEIYNFDSVPSQLTLTTVPVAINFSGMSGGVYLQTNGTSTVNDLSGTVIVDGMPPC
jgi:hypothetical protein